VSPERDVKQFRQACREVGLDRDARYEAAKDFHAEKRASGDREHTSYGELLAWLREWKDAHGDD
jgi:hypothetical protein